MIETMCTAINQALDWLPWLLGGALLIEGAMIFGGAAIIRKRRG